MTVAARRFVSIAERTASATWTAVSQLLVPGANSAPSAELASIAGIASSLISCEAMTAAIVLHGTGLRVRVYCLYNGDAIDGDVPTKRHCRSIRLPATGRCRCSPLSAAVESHKRLQRTQ